MPGKGEEGRDASPSFSHSIPDPSILVYESVGDWAHLIIGVFKP